MGVSKVEYGDQVVMDITDSTVTPEGLVEGVVAYNAAGERIVGTGDYVPSTRTVNGKALSADITLGAADVLGYTPTNSTVIPNDNGEVKTKYRMAQKGYFSSGVGYYKLCTLPVNNTGNYASAIISGRIGGWTSDNMSYFNALVWNRGTPGISLINIAGAATAMSSIWSICDLVLYVNGTSTTGAATATLYAKCASYFTFDFDIEVFQSSAAITYDGTYITTTPSGTLAAQASTSTKRLELINGSLLANGTALVPATRTVNGKALSANITLSASDVGVVIDSALSDTSANPVQNKVIKAALDALGGGGANVEYGTYTGVYTDQSGSKYHSSLTFSFVPKVVLIFSPGDEFAIFCNPSYFWGTYWQSSAWKRSRFTFVSWSTTIEWYATSTSDMPSIQMDDASYTYAYVAIG